MFELASPWVLLLLPLPLLVWFFLPRAALQLPAALNVPFFHAVTTLVDNEQKRLVTHSQIGFFLVLWSLLVLSLAGPRWVGEPEPLAREGYNILLTLDISGSMELPDMVLHGRQATRLDVVKETAMQFVKSRTTDKLGLILFGSNAYLQTPLTYDQTNVLMRLEDATVGLAGKTTSIGDALGLAVKRLQHVPVQGRIIILLTDGVNNSGVLTPIKVAALAKADGIKVYTIGLGSDDGSVDAFGGMFLADLDETTLKKIATITKGRYFRANNTQSLQAIYETINRLEVTQQDSETVRPQEDYYAWPLGIACLLLLCWFVRLWNDR